MEGRFDAQFDRSYHGRVPDQRNCNQLRKLFRRHTGSAEEIQGRPPFADLHRKLCPRGCSLGRPLGRPRSAGRVAVREQEAAIHPGGPYSGGKMADPVPMTRGIELLFHDPLSDSSTTRQSAPDRMRSGALNSAHDQKPAPRTPPASRSDQLDAVVRELKLLARRNGTALE